MATSQEFVYVKTVHINEGITTGQVTKASLFMTAKYIFVVPHDSIQLLGDNATQTNYTNTEEFLADLLNRLEQSEIEQVEQELLAFLPDERVFEIASLKKLKVNVGFWFFGGMKLAKNNEGTKVINVQPKAKREEIKEFYELSA